MNLYSVNNMHLYRKFEKGMTLLEIAIAGLISVMVIAAFSVFFLYFFQSYQFSFEENLAISEAERGMRTILRYARVAKTADNGSYALVTTNDQEFAFYSNIDQDTDTERVRYFLDGTALKQGIIEPSGIPLSYPTESEKVKTIIDYVRNDANPVFYYYNGSWPADTANNPLTPANRLLETRLIKVFLQVKVSNQSLPEVIDITSSVQLRNLKDNL